MDEYYQVHNINEAINALTDESKPFPPALLYTFRISTRTISAS